MVNNPASGLRDFRTFLVFPEPSIVDPAHMVKVAEVKRYQSFSDRVEYSDTKVLRDLLDEMDKEEIRNEARDAANKEMLEVLGMTFESYIEHKKYVLSKKSLPNV